MHNVLYIFTFAMLVMLVIPIIILNFQKQENLKEIWVYFYDYSEIYLLYKFICQNIHFPAEILEVAFVIIYIFFLPFCLETFLIHLFSDLDMLLSNFYFFCFQ